MPKPRRKIQKVRIKTPEVCPFCEAKKTPTYKDHQFLGQFLSERAKILGRQRTGLCNLHQRSLPREVKRARFLGLLPFVPRI